MSENLTVFIVDDDPAVRDALSLLLGIQNSRVAVYGDAESFLKAYKKEWRGCVLLDIHMPGMDGLTVQKCLNESDSELPVIIMTGHGDVASAREAFRAFAVDFLEKPLDNKTGFKARFNCLFCKLNLANLCKTRYTGATHFFLSKTKNGGSLL